MAVFFMLSNTNKTAAPFSVFSNTNKMAPLASYSQILPNERSFFSACVERLFYQRQLYGNTVVAVGYGVG